MPGRPSSVDQSVRHRPMTCSVMGRGGLFRGEVALSQEWGGVVVTCLIGLGVSAMRLPAIGDGPNVPVGKNVSNNGRADDRCVCVVMSLPAGSS